MAAWKCGAFNGVYNRRPRFTGPPVLRLALGADALDKSAVDGDADVSLRGDVRVVRYEDERLMEIIHDAAQQLHDLI